jgi:hypothetical protein
MDTITYETTPCLHCNKTSEVTVSKDALDAWLNGMYIQDAFPDESADTRELIKTGMHSECWDEIMNKELFR